jgi:hypothetical protein
MILMNLLTVTVNIDKDFKFFAITPAINLNFHSSTLEFEWLFFAIYFDFKLNFSIIERDNNDYNPLN